MSIFRSNDGKAHFEFEKTDSCDANGSKMIEFRIRVGSDGFSSDLRGIWFYHDDLTKFVSDIANLISGTTTAANLRAMSEFYVTIVPVDERGHFAAKFSLANARAENSASLTVKVETQQLSELAAEFQIF